MKNINEVFISLAIVSTTFMTTLCYGESGKAPSPVISDIRFCLALHQPLLPSTAHP